MLQVVPGGILDSAQHFGGEFDFGKFSKSQVNLGSYISDMDGQICPKLISERELIKGITCMSSVSVKMSVIVEIIALMSETFYFSIFLISLICLTSVTPKLKLYLQIGFIIVSN